MRGKSISYNSIRVKIVKSQYLISLTKALLGFFLSWLHIIVDVIFACERPDCFSVVQTDPPPLPPLNQSDKKHTMRFFGHTKRKRLALSSIQCHLLLRLVNQCLVKPKACIKRCEFKDILVIDLHCINKHFARKFVFVCFSAQLSGFSTVNLTFRSLSFLN